MSLTPVSTIFGSKMNFTNSNLYFFLAVLKQIEVSPSKLCHLGDLCRNQCFANSVFGRFLQAVLPGSLRYDPLLSLLLIHSSRDKKNPRCSSDFDDTCIHLSQTHGHPVAERRKCHKMAAIPDPSRLFIRQSPRTSIDFDDTCSSGVSLGRTDMFLSRQDANTKKKKKKTDGGVIYH